MNFCVVKVAFSVWATISSHASSEFECVVPNAFFEGWT